MKFTKLMALALVLVMLVSSFVACGGGDGTETNDPGTDAPGTSTDAPGTDTEAPGTDTEAPGTDSETESETEACKHPRTKDGESLAATCTTDGYTTKTCLLCKEEVERVVIPAAHTETGIDSVDGNHKKMTCTVCGNVRIADKDGNTVADATGILFPFFSTGFEGKADMTAALAGFADVKLGDNQFTRVVYSAADANTYVNVPSGTSDVAPNGCFVIEDVNSKLAAADFSVSLKVQFVEMPVNTISLVSWTVGGTAYNLVSINAKGEIVVLGNDATVALADKGWDAIKVEVDVDTGNYYVYLNNTYAAKGAMGAAATGKNGSSIKFFELASQFEANIDDVNIQDGITLEVPASYAKVYTANFDTATTIEEAFAEFATDFAISASSKDGAYSFADGQLVSVASPAIFLADTNGILMGGKFEVSFDVLLGGQTGGNAVFSLNKRDGGKANEMRILSEYSGRLAFNGDNKEFLQAEGIAAAWTNVKVVVDPTHYDYTIYFDGVKVLYTEWVEGTTHKVFATVNGGEMVESTVNYTNDVSPFHNISGKIDGLYFGHFVSAEQRIDNIRLAIYE